MEIKESAVVEIGDNIALLDEHILLAAVLDVAVHVVDRLNEVGEGFAAVGCEQGQVAPSL